jgi:hypothetical protein
MIKYYQVSIQQSQTSQSRDLRSFNYVEIHCHTQAT